MQHGIERHGNLSDLSLEAQIQGRDPRSAVVEDRLIESWTELSRMDPPEEGMSRIGIRIILQIEFEADSEFQSKTPQVLA